MDFDTELVRFADKGAQIIFIRTVVAILEFDMIIDIFGIRRHRISVPERFQIDGIEIDFLEEFQRFADTFHTCFLTDDGAVPCRNAHHRGSLIGQAFDSVAKVQHFQIIPVKIGKRHVIDDPLFFLTCDLLRISVKRFYRFAVGSFSDEGVGGIRVLRPQLFYVFVQLVFCVDCGLQF